MQFNHRLFTSTAKRMFSYCTRRNDWRLTTKRERAKPQESQRLLSFFFLLLAGCSSSSWLAALPPPGWLVAPPKHGVASGVVVTVPHLLPPLKLEPPKASLPKSRGTTTLSCTASRSNRSSHLAGFGAAGIWKVRVSSWLDRLLLRVLWRAGA